MYDAMLNDRILNVKNSTQQAIRILERAATRILPQHGPLAAVALKGLECAIKDLNEAYDKLRLSEAYDKLQEAC